MAVAEETFGFANTGLLALALLLRVHSIATDSQQMHYALAKAPAE